jgi:hypothetical protein
MRATASIALCLILGACVNQQQLAAQRAAQQAALNAQDESTCRSYGAQKGTDQYFNCRMMLNTQRNQAALAQQQMTVQQSNAMMGYSAALLQAGQPHYVGP